MHFQIRYVKVLEKVQAIRDTNYKTNRTTLGVHYGLAYF